MVNRYRAVLSLCFFLVSQTSAASDIHQAIKNHGWDALTLLAQLSKSERVEVINQQNQFGETVLFKAAGKGLPEVVKFLVDHGAKVEMPNQSNLTPLSNAASVGHMAVVRILLAAGASVASVNRQGAMPLHHAAASGSPDTVDMLIKAGALVNAVDSAGSTPLFYAVQEGDEECTRLLVQAGANLNQRDLQGETALYYAAKSGHFEVAHCLLEYKADPNIKNNFGNFPLHGALDSGDSRVIELFVDRSVSQEAMKDQTLLHRAARNCQEAVVQCLIQNGWRADVVDEDGNTPLHDAAQFGNEPVVKYLVNICGLNVDQPNKGGWTPLLLAVKAQSLEVVSFLLKVAGAKVDTERTDRDTGLGVAASQEDCRMMNKLFEFGVFIDDTTLDELEEQEEYGLYDYKKEIQKHWDQMYQFLSSLQLPKALTQLLGEFVRVSPAQLQRRLTRGSDVVPSLSQKENDEKVTAPAPKKAMIKPPGHHKK